MKSFNAILRKEYLETRSQSLLFLVLGAILPFALQGLFGFGRDGFLEILRSSGFIFGGLVAVWLNATILCATTWARERENGTIGAIRELSPSGRVAVAGKLTWIFLSTLMLAIAFTVASLVADKLRGAALGSSIFEFPKSQFGRDFALYVKGSGIALAFCWGLFWTSKLSRQATSVLLTVVSALVAGIVAARLSKAIFGTVDRTTLFAALFGLLAILAAPIRLRFKARSKVDETARDPKALEAQWANVDMSKSPEFGSLVARVATEASLFFRSPASLLVELGLLVAGIGIFCAHNPPTGAGFDAIAGIAALYFVCVASGLFIDAKRENSPLKTQLDVGPNRYWLANLLVAGILALVCFVAIPLFFAWTYDRFSDYPALYLGSSLALCLGVGLWSASLRGSRLIVGARTIILACVATYAVGWVWAIGRFDKPELALSSLLVGIGVVFALCSIPAARRKLGNRKVGFAPFLALVATGALFLGYADQFKKAPKAEIPRWKTSAAFLNATLPQTEEEYNDLKERVKKEVESIEAPELFGEKFDQRLNQTIDAAREFLVACEKTKRFAAEPREALEAEKNLYDSYLEARRQFPLPGAKDPIKFLEFLAQVPEKRPTNEEVAINAYVFARFGALERYGNYFDVGKKLSEAKGKTPDLFELAAWNLAQTRPTRDAEIERALETRDFAPEKSAFQPPLALGPGCEIYNDLLDALDFDREIPALELARRAIFIEVVASRRGEGPMTFVAESYEQLLLDPQIPDAFNATRPWVDAIEADRLAKADAEGPIGVCGTECATEIPADPWANLSFYGRDRANYSNLIPVVSRPTRPAFNDKGEFKLIPYLDFDKKELKTPDGRVAYERVRSQPLPGGGSEDSPYNSARFEADFGERYTDGSIQEQKYYLANYAVPLFDSDGERLASPNGAYYYGLEYNWLSPEGPVVLHPAACQSEPPFDAEGIPIFKDRKLSDLSTRGDIGFTDPSAIARVLGVAVLKPNGRNVRLIPNLWLKHQRVDPSTYATSADITIKSTRANRFVDATGAEVLGSEPSENGEPGPKFALKRGVFLDAENVYKPGFEYQIVLPKGIDVNSVRVVEPVRVGEWKDDQRPAIVKENGRIYTKFPAVGVLIPTSRIFNKNLEETRNDRPILVLESLTPFAYR
ncbi:MAG: hypothetical protein IJM30_03465 [Thermoguttaceae bacterium]|nr:hypothetical protein [Thermoguttaceae bacterium]